MSSQQSRAARVAILTIALALCAIAGIAIARSRQGASMSRQAAGPATRELWHCGMHPQVVQDHPGDCPICHMALTPIATSHTSKTSLPARWWDPMLGPSSITDHPGKSAMGMEMVPFNADDAGSPDVHIEPAVVQNMGIRTARATIAPLKQTLRVTGIVKLPEPAMHDVSLKVGGWIDHLYADQEGMHVNQGEPLFDLYSQDLQVAAQELISAVAARKLLAADAPPDLRRQSEAFIESARRKLALWDIADSDIDAIARAAHPPKDIPIRSPATGHIVEKAIVDGSPVQPMTKLLRIEDHSHMWLEAQVYSDQIPLLKLGQSLEATVEGASADPFVGAISFIAPHLDHMTRSLTVRATLDNPQFVLKPGMYAAVTILTRPLGAALQVPREAVIDTGVRRVVFIVTEPGHFAPRTVRTGLTSDDGQIQILDGLHEGDTVVTSGQFLLDVESRTQEATQKLAQ